MFKRPKPPSYHFVTARGSRDAFCLRGRRKEAERIDRRRSRGGFCHRWVTITMRDGNVCSAARGTVPYGNWRRLAKSLSEKRASRRDAYTTSFVSKVER